MTTLRAALFTFDIRGCRVTRSFLRFGSIHVHDRNNRIEEGFSVMYCLHFIFWAYEDVWWNWYLSSAVRSIVTRDTISVSRVVGSVWMRKFWQGKRGSNFSATYKLAKMTKNKRSRCFLSTFCCSCWWCSHCPWGQNFQESNKSARFKIFCLVEWLARENHGLGFYKETMILKLHDIFFSLKRELDSADVVVIVKLNFTLDL